MAGGGAERERTARQCLRKEQGVRASVSTALPAQRSGPRTACSPTAKSTPIPVSYTHLTLPTICSV
eukprot:2917774-Rhodomonas_salina.1